MLYGIYQIQNIINTSHLMFGCPDVDVENLKMLNSYDYAEMYHILSDIKDIIDKIIQKEDENMNIGELMADQDQEGEGNEL